MAVVMADAAERTDHVAVLIVEDHALLADGLASALDHERFDACVAADLTPGGILAAAERHRPAVVLLDLLIGGAVDSTIGLIGPLRERGAVVLVLTGVTDPAVHASCLEAGASGVISKREPFSTVREQVVRGARGEPVMSPWDRQSLIDQARRERRQRRARLAPFELLTVRERSVLAALMNGRSAEEIARDSFVSLATVRSQIRAVLTKLGVRSQLAAVVLAHRAGWSPDTG